MLLEANKRETGSSVILIFGALLISQLLASNVIGSGSNNIVAAHANQRDLLREKSIYFFSYGELL